MNPQAGKAAFGGDVDSAPPGLGALGGGAPPDPLAAAPAGGAPPPGADAGGDSHVEVHHGGHPDGTPPPTEMTQFHTIAADPTGNPTDIRNHDDYAGADQHVKEVMGQDTGMEGMPDLEGLGANPPGLGEIGGTTSGGGEYS